MRPRRTTLLTSHRLSTPHGNGPNRDATGSTPGSGGFLNHWLLSLAPSLRAIIFSGIACEAARRASDDPFGSIASQAAELLVAACAEAHGLSVGELRALVPSINSECRQRVRSSLRSA